jgi:hypothetical protein
MDSWSYDDEPYSGNEGRHEHNGPAGTDGPGPYWGQASGNYGSCGYCHVWTYHDLWRGSCGECRWRWGHYPDTMPTELARYRAEMPAVHSAEACHGTSCPVYGSLPVS